MNGHDKLVKVNFGCGTNKLKSWQNYDAEMDITKRLPFGNGAIDYILAEHVVEHIGYYDALLFFKECHRVLAPGGVARIAVPSIERIGPHGNQSYFDFVHSKKWAPKPDRRGAMHAILHRHGHRAAWTASLLAASLDYAGFDAVVHRDPGLSNHEELRGVEGHGRVIGDEFNAIETTICEATKGS